MTKPLDFSPRELTDKYLRRQYDELSEQFLTVLRHFDSTFYASIDESLQAAIDAFVLTFLHLFSQADYVPSRDYGIEFVRHNLVLANLVALSALKTTDPYLAVVGRQPNNIIKILTLYSARNSIRLDRERLFAADPELAAIWYLSFGSIFHSGLVRRDVCENLEAHYRYTPSVFQAGMKIADIYYGCSYVSESCDWHIKPSVNSWLRALLGRCQIRNRPNPRKVAVLSCLWWRGHSIHRNYSAFLEAMHDYELTLFHVPMAGRAVDTSPFHAVAELRFDNGELDLGPLRDNDFMVAYFPDVGMTPFSIWLANLRLAPIQIASPGHSVSTWGAEIDYYLSGVDVEIPDHPERNYSERLVLLPGCGVIHDRPDYVPAGRSKSAPEIILNCPWSAQKVNHAFVGLLGQIVQRSQKPLRIRVFVGTTLRRHADFVPFTRDLSALLAPAVVEILPDLSYTDYMARMEEGDLSLDSYHYGGCNTVADSLYLGKPIVALEGSHWYNRIGPQMLRMAGLPDLIATTEEQYAEVVLRLIHDDGYRSAVAARLGAADLASTIFNREDAGCFRKAVAYLIENNERLNKEKDRTAIRIGSDD